MSHVLSEQPELRLTATPAGERTVLAAAGEVDVATAEDFAAAVREHLAHGPVLLDLRDLRFMDSSGVRALDALLRDAAREGWTLRIRSDLHRNVRRVLEVTGMLEVLPLEDEPGTAGRT